MNWIKAMFSKKHVHYFKIEDVMNTKIDPVCRCGKKLTEAYKEKKDLI